MFQCCCWHNKETNISLTSNDTHWAIESEMSPVFRLWALCLSCNYKVNIHPRALIPGGVLLPNTVHQLAPHFMFKVPVGIGNSSVIRKYLRVTLFDIFSFLSSIQFYCAWWNLLLFQLFVSSSDDINSLKNLHAVTVFQ